MKAKIAMLQMEVWWHTATAFFWSRVVRFLEMFDKPADGQMEIPPVDTVTSEDQARTLAIDWQNWQSEQSMSWGELADWQGFFAKLVEKFPSLADEFKENAIC